MQFSQTFTNPLKIVSVLHISSSYCSYCNGRVNWKLLEITATAPSYSVGNWTIIMGLSVDLFPSGIAKMSRFVSSTKKDCYFFV